MYNIILIIVNYLNVYCMKPNKSLVFLSEKKFSLFLLYHNNTFLQNKYYCKNNKL